VRALLDLRHHLTPCRSVGAQLIGDDALRRQPLLLAGKHDVALQKHFLDMTQVQKKPVIQPDRTADDLGRKTMT
jgi:hypothetical protein